METRAENFGRQSRTSKGGEEEEEISKFSLDKVLGTKFHPALEVS